MKRPARRSLMFIGASVLLLVVLAFAFAFHWEGPQRIAYRVETHPLVQTVVASGRVVSVSRAQVGSQISGVVVERRVREGDLVAPGDVLVVLRADDLEASVREAEAALAQLQQTARPQAQAVLRDAEARFTQARRETERRRLLFERKLIAKEPMEQAVQVETAARALAEQARLAARTLGSGAPGEVVARERLAAARAAMDKTLIRAQVAGTVLTRDAEPGDVVQPGKVLFEIARKGDTEVLILLDEKNLGAIALDQQAQCIADAYPDRPFPAVVSFIAPSVDPQRGTVEVRMTVKPVPAYLRQDMTVSVNVETGRREHALVVPNDALMGISGGHAVLWRVVDGKALRTQVTLGLRGLVLSEVTAGLKEGEWVLAAGGTDMTEGERVRVKLEKLPAVGSDRATRNEPPLRVD